MRELIREHPIFVPWTCDPDILAELADEAWAKSPKYNIWSAVNDLRSSQHPALRNIPLCIAADAIEAARRR